MLGSSIAEAWHRLRPDDELVALTRDDLDLRDRARVDRLFGELRPDAVIHAAAKVGGISAKLANPTDYLLDNLEIDSSVFQAAIRNEVPELLYIGSAAVYPAEVGQPIPESALLSGRLESANEGYGIAKLAGQKLAEYASAQYGFSYRTALPSNLYGPNDDFSPSHGHLIAAAIGKVHSAMVAGDPSVGVWGDGTARREFTYAPDLASWLVLQLGRLATWPSALNLGVGHDNSIAEYYRVALDVVGFSGELEFDASKPAGVPQRLLDSSAARALGWDPATPLRDGMASAYDSYLNSETRGPR